jgi:hypothetical protein
MCPTLNTTTESGKKTGVTHQTRIKETKLARRKKHSQDWSNLGDRNASNQMKDERKTDRSNKWIFIYCRLKCTNNNLYDPLYE